MKCKLLMDMEGDPCEEFPDGTRMAGTILDDPEAFWLVLNGCAEPADEECRKRAGMTPEQVSRAHQAYLMLDAGVIPEDRIAWERGWMRGYDPNGNWIPGPNVDEFDELAWEEYKKTSRLILP